MSNSRHFLKTNCAGGKQLEHKIFYEEKHSFTCLWYIQKHRKFYKVAGNNGVFKLYNAFMNRVPFPAKQPLIKKRHS